MPKHLFPTVSCIFITDGRPTLYSSLKSILTQTRTDFQVIVIDSARAFRKGNESWGLKARHAYKDLKDHPLLDWYFTGESLEKDYSPVARCFNQAYTQGLISGKYFCTFYDDDLYHPQFMEKMTAFLEENPHKDAVRCSQEVVEIDEDENIINTRPTRVADATLTSSDIWDCHVDGAQVMMKTTLLDDLYSSMSLLDDEQVATMRPEFFPESNDPDIRSHSDGIFFERIKTVMSECGYIEECLCTHRHTPWSTYTHHLQATLRAVKNLPIDHPYMLQYD